MQLQKDTLGITNVDLNSSVLLIVIHLSQRRNQLQDATIIIENVSTMPPKFQMEMSVGQEKMLSPKIEYDIEKRTHNYCNINARSGFKRFKN